jgi:hypothetical protein
MQAVQITKKSGKHSTDQVLLAASFYIPGELPQLQTRKPNTWNLFLHHEKDNAPEVLLQQNIGIIYNKSHPGLKGNYQ